MYETSPESRLWGAFLLSVVRDMVPIYVTSTSHDPKISSMSDGEFRNITETAIFRLACHACDLAPSFVIKKMNELRMKEPDDEFLLYHRAKHPKGGSTPLVKVHQYYIEDFYKVTKAVGDDHE